MAQTFSKAFMPLLIMAMFSFNPVFAQWSYLGSQGFSDGFAWNTQVAIDTGGLPYVAFVDHVRQDKVTVMKHLGNAWVNVGIPGFSDSFTKTPVLALSQDGKPYVVYTCYGKIGQIFVERFNGIKWESVGNSPVGIPGEDPVIAFGSGQTPYVAYKDPWQNSAYLTVMKYDGTNWVTVGSPRFSLSIPEYVSMTIDKKGTPYVAYVDLGKPHEVTVMKFDGTDWVAVDTAGISAGKAYYVSLALGPDGTPYVGYKDVANNNKATVLKYNGAHWVSVGKPGFSKGEIYYSSLVVDENGTPYFGCQGWTTRATVYKYDGKDWVLVGVDGFSAGNAEHTSLALDKYGTLIMAYKDTKVSDKISSMIYYCAYSVPDVPICSVLNDTISGFNTIVWSNNGNAYVDSYFVYRENNGSYKLIASLAKTLASQFVDVTAKPTLNSYSYKLAVKDKCWRYSDTAAFVAHKTIRLSFDYLSGNKGTISWNAYDGISVLYYVVMRSTDNGAFIAIDTVFGGLSPSYTYVDKNVPVGINIYRIDVPLNSGCDAGSGIIYDKITSNKVTAWTTGVNIVQGRSQNITLQPNPAKNNVKVLFNKVGFKLQLRVIDVLGKVVFKEEINGMSGQHTIPLNDIPSGLYVVELQGENVRSSQKLLKE
ncbi:MAG: T9SS type A sorting domain-containing protein [Chitinophagaceae bacterium]|nr:T9SS type A sorting domain-containing protein [Chitinophagaceae bacterium]